MAHTIKASDCDANSIATVHGIIQYARVMNPYTDEEIDDRNRRNEQYCAKNGKVHFPSQDRTEITIVNPQICYANPAAPTPIEQYVAERIFTTVSGEKRFNVGSKSTFSPACMKSDGADGAIKFVASAEPAAGNEVIIGIRCYEIKNGKYAGTKGVSLNTLYFPNPNIEYKAPGMNQEQFAAAQFAQTLQGLGILKNATVIDEETGLPLGITPTNPEALEGTPEYEAAVAATPRTNVGADMVYAATQAVPPTPHPVPAPVPQPAPGWTPAAPAGYTETVAPAPEPVQSPTQPKPGIVFNPNA